MTDPEVATAKILRDPEGELHCIDHGDYEAGEVVFTVGIGGPGDGFLVSYEAEKLCPICEVNVTGTGHDVIAVPRLSVATERWLRAHGVRYDVLAEDSARQDGWVLDGIVEDLAAADKMVMDAYPEIYPAQGHATLVAAVFTEISRRRAEATDGG